MDPIDIFIFCNGCSANWHNAVALTADGEVVHQHVCSHHGFMALDSGTRQSERYDALYPQGWVLRLVDPDDAQLAKAIALNQAKHGIEVG